MSFMHWLDARPSHEIDPVLDCLTYLAKESDRPSSPVLLRARTPLELRAIQAEPDPHPFGGRQFERTDRIIVRFAVIGPAAADAKPQADWT